MPLSIGLSIITQYHPSYAHSYLIQLHQATFSNKLNFPIVFYLVIVSSLTNCFMFNFINNVMISNLDHISVGLVQISP